jgi:hypothetical protein
VAALDSGMVSSPHFDHEKLDVYQLELKFLSWVTQFLADLPFEHEHDDEHD